MSKRSKTFLELVLRGDVSEESVDDFVDEWHNAPNHIFLREFLGMTNQEYSLSVRDPDRLSHIIKARQDKIPLKVALGHN
jgi:hypothetical protein